MTSVSTPISHAIGAPLDRIDGPCESHRRRQLCLRVSGRPGVTYVFPGAEHDRQGPDRLDRRECRAGAARRPRRALARERPAARASAGRPGSGGVPIRRRRLSRAVRRRRRRRDAGDRASGRESGRRAATRSSRTTSSCAPTAAISTRRVATSFGLYRDRYRPGRRRGRADRRAHRARPHLHDAGRAQQSTRAARDHRDLE